MNILLQNTLLAILFSIGNTDDACQHLHYEDVLLKSTAYSKSKLKLNLKEWEGFVDSLLRRQFPIDLETRNSIRKVRNAIFSIVYPTPFRSAAVLASFKEDVLNDILDMDARIVHTTAFVLVANGGAVIRGPEPMAHRYGGHQFGSWADQLGDGRAHLLGEYTNTMGERWELQLKGSGVTPYSRSGDGRAVIRSSVREFLCSEAMHHLGVPTSRAATLSVSNDKVMRDQFYNGNHQEERTAVVLRLAPSWFRFGSFEILAKDGEFDLLHKLADFIIEHHFPHIDSNDYNKYLILFDKVVEKTAHMIAMWQSVGFAHGVMNTDNFSILSITIDYGPFGFMEEYDPELVPNTSDDESMYSYQNQPDVGYFNLEKLAKALSPLVGPHRKFLFQQILKGYPERYKTKFTDLFRRKLGLENTEEGDEYLVALLLKIMAESRADFSMTFRELGECDLDLLARGESVTDRWSLHKLSSHEDFLEWINMYSDRLSRESLHEKHRRNLMNSVNPRYVLRNWIAEEIIRNVEHDDFDLLNQAMNIFRNPYMEQKAAEDLGFASIPPSWASGIRVSCSS